MDTEPPPTRPWLRLRIRNSRVRRTRLRGLWIRTRRVRDTRVRLRIWIETVRGPEVPLWIRIGCAKPALLRWTAIRLCGWAPAATAHGGALSDRSRAPPLSQSQSMLGAARSQAGRFFNHCPPQAAGCESLLVIAARRARALPRSEDGNWSAVQVVNGRRPTLDSLSYVCSSSRTGSQYCGAVTAGCDPQPT